MDNYEKLKQIKELLDKGLISEDEFSKLKSDILFSNENIQKPRKKEEFNRDLANGLVSGSKYNELNNELTEKSNGNLNKDHSGKFLLVMLVIVGVLFFTFSIKNSNKQNNNSTVQDTLNSTYSSPSINSYSESTTTCKVCGRNFTGDGYDKIDGVWQRNTNIQTELCSQNCAMIDNQRQNEKYNAILVKHGYAPIDFDSQSSTSNHPQPNSNGYFTGSDGQLHQSSPCGNCHHTGYIDMGDGMQVCPMCNGRGEIIH